MRHLFFRRIVLLTSFGILLSLVCGIQAQVANNSFEPRFALVIGNSDYGELGKLKNPVNDASDMAASLKRLGFEVDLLLNAELAQMEDAVVRLSDKLAKDPKSTGLFYFAGHGVQTQKGENYLIPVQTKIAAETFLKTKALAFQSVLDLMQFSGNRLDLVFLDACRNNPFSWARSTTRGLSIVSSQPPGSIVVYATSAGSVAQDGTGRNGVFTGELLKNLETSGIDLNTMLDRTAQGVLAATKNQQNPAVYKQFFGTEYLAGGDGKTNSVVSRDTSQDSNDGPKFGEIEINYGSLTVNLLTAGTLEISGKIIDIPSGGSLPIKNLKPGSYTLTVRYSDGQIESKTINIIAGQAASLNFSYIPSKTNKESEEVSVPSLKNKTFSEVKNLLEAVKLKVEKVEVYDDFVVKDMVVSQEPSAGTMVKVNSVVTVKISKGTDKVIVPSLVGLSQERATNIIYELKLIPVVNIELSDYTPLTVCSQSPAPNTLVMPGSSVVIGISVGNFHFDYGLYNYGLYNYGF